MSDWTDLYLTFNTNSAVLDAVNGIELLLLSPISVQLSYLTVRTVLI